MRAAQFQFHISHNWLRRYSLNTRRVRQLDSNNPRPTIFDLSQREWQAAAHGPAEILFASDVAPGGLNQVYA
jgi:cell division inhibitor SulA